MKVTLSGTVDVGQNSSSTNRHTAWERLPISAAWLFPTIVLFMAGVSIAAFLLAMPLLALGVALLGDALLIVITLRLHRTGHPLDEPLSTSRRS